MRYNKCLVFFSRTVSELPNRVLTSTLLGPFVDKSYISASPATELLAGQYKKPLPQILGHNAAEVSSDSLLDQSDMEAKHCS